MVFSTLAPTRLVPSEFSVISDHLFVSFFTYTELQLLQSLLPDIGASGRPRTYSSGLLQLLLQVLEYLQPEMTSVPCTPSSSAEVSVLGQQGVVFFAITRPQPVYTLRLDLTNFWVFRLVVLFVFVAMCTKSVSWVSNCY